MVVVQGLVEIPAGRPDVWTRGRASAGDAGGRVGDLEERQDRPERDRTRWSNFLLWKQSLDPTRFAHYHPKLAPALHKIELARSSPTLTQQATAPTTTSTGGSAILDADGSGDLRAAEPDPAGQSGAEHAPDGRRDGRLGHRSRLRVSPSRRVTAAPVDGTLVRPPRLW